MLSLWRRLILIVLAIVVGYLGASCGASDESDAVALGSGVVAAGPREDVEERLGRLEQIAAPLDSVVDIERVDPDVPAGVQRRDVFQHYCPWETVEVPSLRQNELTATGSVVRYFVLFDEEADAESFLTDVERLTATGCENRIERSDRPAISVEVVESGPVDVSGTRGIRNVYINRVEVDGRGPDVVESLYVREGRIVIVARSIGGLFSVDWEAGDHSPHLERLALDGLNLVGSGEFG